MCVRRSGEYKVAHSQHTFVFTLWRLCACNVINNNRANVCVGVYAGKARISRPGVMELTLTIRASVSVSESESVYVCEPAHSYK